MLLRVSLIAAMALCPAAHASVTSYTCNFLIAASPNGLEKQKVPFEMQYVSDTGKNTNYLIGKLGSEEVEMVTNFYGVSFIARTASGNISVTTITKSGDAVHSRNTIIGNELLPSQFYGKCIRQ